MVNDALVNGSWVMRDRDHHPSTRPRSTPGRGRPRRASGRRCRGRARDDDALRGGTVTTAAVVPGRRPGRRRTGRRGRRAHPAARRGCRRRHRLPCPARRHRVALPSRPGGGPGLVTADDFATGTRAALAGARRPSSTSPRSSTARRWPGAGARRHEKAAGKAVTDYAFHPAMTQWQPSFAAELADMVEAGGHLVQAPISPTATSMMVEDDEVLAALQASAALGTTIGFHRENGPGHRRARPGRARGPAYRRVLPPADPAGRAGT